MHTTYIHTHNQSYSYARTHTTRFLFTRRESTSPPPSTNGTMQRPCFSQVSYQGGHKISIMIISTIAQRAVTNCSTLVPYHSCYKEHFFLRHSKNKKRDNTDENTKRSARTKSLSDHQNERLCAPCSCFSLANRSVFVPRCTGKLKNV